MSLQQVKQHIDEMFESVSIVSTELKGDVLDFTFGELKAWLCMEGDELKLRMKLGTLSELAAKVMDEYDDSTDHRFLLLSKLSLVYPQGVFGTTTDNQAYLEISTPLFATKEDVHAAIFELMNATNEFYKRLNS